MRLALPLWESKISPVLDSATRLLVVDVEDKDELSRSEIHLDGMDLPMKCRKIRDIGVDVLICGAVTRQLAARLKASGINIVPGISGRLDDVLHACFHGNLARSEYLMPGWSLDGMEELLGGLNLQGSGSPKARNLKKRSSLKEDI